MSYSVPQAASSPPEPLVVAVPVRNPTDGLPEIDFAAAARLAARLCAAPIAFVALAQGKSRLQIEAAFGISVPALEQCLARPDAGAPLVIEELPLVDAAGGVQGAIGVLDVLPRRLDDAQRAGLLDLAGLLAGALSARRHAAELARQAMVDPLTGVANRKQFDNALLAELHHAMRSGEPFTLLLLSLDGVVDIRNGFGAPAADAALREVAARMARQVRLGDLLARLGGGDFGAVMRHGAADAAELLARRIVAAVRQPLTLASGDVVGLRVCIGIAAYDDSVDSVAMMMAQAEQALQLARRQHEQRWNFFGRRFETPLRLVGGAGDDPAA